MINKIYAVIFLLMSSSLFAAEWTDSAEIERLFADAGLTGTFVLYDVSNNTFAGHAQERAMKRFFPASTFKIPNSLIGLEVGAVSDVDEVLPYGGQPQTFKSWEQDMALRDAIIHSNLPVYQELARRIGLESMAENVKKMSYGNGHIGAVVDTFWLGGPLTISAVEQAQFLAQLAQGSLPFSETVQEQVRAITLLDQGEGWALYGKTGWTTATDPGIGWWVGWVVKQGRIYSFALNIDMADIADAPKRIEVGRASLQALGVL